MRFSSCLTFWSDKALAVLIAPVVPSTEKPKPREPSSLQRVRTYPACSLHGCGKGKGTKQTKKRRAAAIAHNCFPAFFAHEEKKELEIVSGTAQGPAGNEERT